MPCKRPNALEEGPALRIPPSSARNSAVFVRSQRVCVAPSVLLLRQRAGWPAASQRDIHKQPPCRKRWKREEAGPLRENIVIGGNKEPFPEEDLEFRVGRAKLGQEAGIVYTERKQLVRRP